VFPAFIAHQFGDMVLFSHSRYHYTSFGIALVQHVAIFVHPSSGSFMHAVAVASTVKISRFFYQLLVKIS
jgi:hypothetical protein